MFTCKLSFDWEFLSPPSFNAIFLSHFLYTPLASSFAIAPAPQFLDGNIEPGPCFPGMWVILQMLHEKNAQSDSLTGFLTVFLCHLLWPIYFDALLT